MLKATLRSAVLLGLLVWSAPSFAEVQNVKVGGDITVRSFFRSNLDLNDKSGALDDHEDFLMSTVGINVGADLTENVSAFIRIANERDWNVNPTSGTNTSSGDLDLSQAYITLKELLYSPLTLRIGQQPITWGRGFVLGSNLIPGTIFGGGDRNASISPNEFTDFTAFDAIRGTLDLSGIAGLPLTIDGVYIKLNENTIGNADDVNLLGFNIGSHFDSMNSEMETYWLNKRDTTRTVLGGIAGKPGSVNTIGIRGSAKPVEGAYTYGELAYQFGDRATDPNAVLRSGDAQQAWAFDLGADYTATSVAMTPKIGAEWIFWSGKDVDGAVGGWDPIARGYFTTALREFQTGTGVGGFYPVSQLCFANGAAGTACTGAQTNQHQLSLYGSVKPIEDLTIAPRLSWFFLDVGALPSAAAAGTQVSKRKQYGGMEWDTVVTYNYTDDVQFGVIYGLFAPGNAYRAGRDGTAQELISSVSVKF